jgi:putative FmdB family regulatory protein
MPIYEYRCSRCGSVQEVITGVSASDDDLACGACGGVELTKIPSVTNVPVYPSPRKGKTCCGRDEKCSSGSSCCGG